MKKFFFLIIVVSFLITAQASMPPVHPDPGFQLSNLPAELREFIDQLTEQQTEETEENRPKPPVTLELLAAGVELARRIVPLSFTINN